MKITPPHPDSLRVAVRQQTYPNTATEREVVDETDRAVFDRVRLHEQALIERARASRTEAQVDEEAAAEIASSLRTEVIRALDRPATEVDLEAIAVRYKQLKALGEQAVRSLNRAIADEEYRRPKLAAPYDDLVALWQKWPTVRPTI
ncbi:hypothetical protein [Leifsonia aquatica]|uniref:hypothetical protein n=1 Tax=Leifsonia aquatica TaxID=144185 RepID=UPI0037F18D18